jgi:alkyl sulfatase BDS1-like metallo-beta-lactamase superfamily hydrolase
VEAGKRYVELAGGADALLTKARKAFDAGDFRWVTEVVNHLVFADPGNTAARDLQADALEQLGYQAESGPWRSFYLTGAQELREPRPKSDKPRPGPVGQIRALPAEQLLDSCSVRLNAEKAADVALKFTLLVRDTKETFEVEIANAVLHHRRRAGAKADATLDRLTLAKLVTGETAPDDVQIGGDRTGLAMLIGLLDRFDFWFEIVAP